ncbi:MAG: hypothetical protein WDN45_00265 [Caulobacteraceae bacterium]
MIAPDQGGGPAGQKAVYAFGGTVERDGGILALDLRLDDTRQHVTVWSEQFRGDDREADRLEAAVASEAALVAGAAIDAEGLPGADTEAVALRIKAEAYARRNNAADREAEWQNQKLLLAKFPKLSHEHANMAVISAFLAAETTPERGAELRALAAKEAAIARQIDVQSDYGYFATALGYPLVGHWREREAALLAGLKARPQSGLLTNHESNLLREVGRLDEAVARARQAAAPKPPSANRDATLLLALAGSGETGEASSLADAFDSAWPNHPAVWNARLETMIFQARWQEAKARFAPGAYRPPQISDAEASAWIQALNAMKSGGASAKAQAAKALKALAPARHPPALPPNEAYSPGGRIGMLAVLGAKDEAFAEADAYLKPDAYADGAFLFWPNLTDFRRDPRFKALVQRIGLTAYWRVAGKWPDFCSDPGAPYDCKTL